MQGTHPGYVSNTALKAIIEKTDGFDKEVLTAALAEIEYQRELILALTNDRLAARPSTDTTIEHEIALLKLAVGELQEAVKMNSSAHVTIYNRLAAGGL